MMGANDMLAVAVVADLSPRPAARVPVDAVMWQVVDEMTQRGRGAVVVEDEGALVGIFTERDLINRLDHTDPLWSHVVVSDVMTPYPMVIRLRDSLGEAVRRLTQGHRRHLPIVDDHGAVIGMLSIRDVLSYVARRFPEELMNLPPDPHHES